MSEHADFAALGINPSSSSSLATMSGKKRKRTTSVTDLDNSQVGLSTEQPCFGRKPSGSESPRTIVSSKLSYLQLQTADALIDCEDRSEQPVHSTPMKIEPVVDVRQNERFSNDERPATSRILNEAETLRRMYSSSPFQFNKVHPSCISHSDLANWPATPSLRPVDACQLPIVVSPLSVYAQRRDEGNDTGHNASFLLAAQQPGPSTEMSDCTNDTVLPEEVDDLPASYCEVGSPSSDRVTRARKRRRSPPHHTLAVNDLVWLENEITGHDPDDPNDDGYGINGIGFRPTPAIAQQRQIRRQKQITDWKRREDGEQRARRRELRREPHAQTISTTESITISKQENGKRVRFAGLEE